MVIGAFALSAWGRPRATLDLDFMILADDISDRLSAMLAAAGFQIDLRWSEYNPMIRAVQRRFRLGAIAVDILLPRDSHDRHAFNKRRRKLFRRRYVWFASPEDLILQKLKSGRPQDFSDAVSILQRSGKSLDLGYLRRWAKRLALTAELDHILRSVSLQSQ
jgi:hypothetical protein